MPEAVIISHSMHCAHSCRQVTPASTKARGFTLIELSIVLVIIGLIVGGILVGQDLIKAAEVRAQISQIEKYNQAVNTFKAKFGAIPGDMPPALANQFGFTLGGSCDGSQQGYRNGDGLLQSRPAPNGLGQNMGETALFWQDLASAPAGPLIEGSYPLCGNSGASYFCGTGSNAWGTTLSCYLPTSKLSSGDSVYVYSYNGFNWFGLTYVTEIFPNGAMGSSININVNEAYKMDTKVDDGLPTTGAVQATYVSCCPIPSSISYAPSAASDTMTSCYNSTTNTYSISSLANYGAGGNCALSFRFQ